LLLRYFAVAFLSAQQGVSIKGYFYCALTARTLQNWYPSGLCRLC